MGSIVAISGWKRSGKDTAAEYLINKYGAKRIAFADPLKEMVCDNYGLTRGLIDNPATKEKPILSLPVCVKDGFSKNNNEFLFGEFRGVGGRIPQDFHIEEGLLLGVEGRDVFQLYWTPRAICIEEGSTKRSVDPDYWVKRALKNVNDGLHVISDLRYRNEAYTLKASDHDVITIRINRFETSPSMDASERDLDEHSFDYIIENKGSLEEFYKKIDDLVTAPTIFEEYTLKSSK